MSYCRFSSDDWRSDVYVYESVEGWVVHVAGSRGDAPIPGPDMKGLIDGRVPPERVAEQVADMNRRIENRNLVPIDHPLAGETRTFGEADSCADWLEHLVGEGFHVPRHVVPALREEADEEDPDEGGSPAEDGPKRITLENADALGYGALMRVDAWLTHIDDRDDEIRERMRETVDEAKEEGETRAATGDADLDAILPGIRSIRVTADAWPLSPREEFTILRASLVRDPDVITVLGIARDAYLVCMLLAGGTNNGGGTGALDEGLLAFAAGSETRLRANPVIGCIDVFNPRPTVYCSYTAWWEGCTTTIIGSELVLKPSIGS